MLCQVMLRKPRALAKMVHGIVAGSPIPVTVKVRGRGSGRPLAHGWVKGVLRRDSTEEARELKEGIDSHLWKESEGGYDSSHAEEPEAACG
jgi:tRNA-dihydrouridine synthase